MDALEKSMESFARVVDRRQVLKGAAGSLFAWITLSLVGPTGRALATGPCPNPQDSSTSCNPPNGTYCSGCSGANCPSGCHIWTGGGYSDGCWCTKSFACEVCYVCWYTCCDCTCGTSHCGCRQLHSTRALC